MPSWFTFDTQLKIDLKKNVEHLTGKSVEKTTVSGAECYVKNARLI